MSILKLMLSMLRILLFCLLVLGTGNLFTQEINFANPSFEGFLNSGRQPRHWFNCSSRNESPPQTQPDIASQVTKKPFDGDTYLGMVTRDNDTWELVGTLLNAPLKQGQCYAFQIALAQSPTYYSSSSTKNIPANFIAPVRFQIWGGGSECEQDELLAESEVISHDEWRVYTFTVQPQKADYWHVVLNVSHPDTNTPPGNGNLLLDAASPFTTLNDCEFPCAYLPLVEREMPGRHDQLILPKGRFFRNKNIDLSNYLSNLLEQFRFHHDEGVLIDQTFQFEDETEVIEGAPYFYELLYALAEMEPELWELLVYDDDPVYQELKVLELQFVLDDLFDLPLRIEAYDNELHKAADWYAKSETQGLYLRVGEE